MPPKQNQDDDGLDELMETFRERGEEDGDALIRWRGAARALWAVTPKSRRAGALREVERRLRATTTGGGGGP